MGAAFEVIGKKDHINAIEYSVAIGISSQGVIAVGVDHYGILVGVEIRLVGGYRDYAFAPRLYSDINSAGDVSEPPAVNFITFGECDQHIRQSNLCHLVPHSNGEILNQVAINCIHTFNAKTARVVCPDMHAGIAEERVVKNHWPEEAVGVIRLGRVVGNTKRMLEIFSTEQARSLLR